MPISIKKAYDVAFSPDGSYLAITTSNAIRLLEPNTGREVWVAKDLSNPSSIAFSPDGLLIAAKNTSGRIKVFDAATGELTIDFKNTKYNEGCKIVWSACGKYLINGSWKGIISIHEAATGKVVSMMEFDWEMIGSILRVGEEWLVMREPKLREGCPLSPPILDIRRLPLDQVMKSHELPEGIVIAADNGAKWIALKSERPPNLHLISREIWNASFAIPTAIGGSFGCLCFSPDDSKLVANCFDDGFKLLSVPEHHVFASVPVPYPSDCAFSPDGKKLAIGSWSKALVLDMREIGLQPANHE